MQENQTNNTQKQNYFTLDYAEVILILGVFFAALVLTGIIQYIASTKLTEQFTYNIIQPILWVIPFLTAIIGCYYIKLKPHNLQYNFGFQFSKWYLYPVMLLFFLGGIILTEPMVELVPTSGLNGIIDEWYQLMMKELKKMLDNYPISSAIMITILAPIFEELLFRGIILKGMLNNKVTPWLAILLSALIFGAVHMNPWQLVGATLLGILLGIVYYKTQSIINVIILHFFNNALGIFVYYNYGEMSISEILNLSPLGSIIFGLLLLIVFGFLFYKLTKKHKWKFS